MPLLALLIPLLAGTAGAAQQGPPQAVVHALAHPGAGWERVRAASEAFLGTPYLVSPLGEGSGIDPDPRLRFDGVDCLTFVETALAIGNAAGSLEATAVALDDIRYRDGAVPAFENRLHLMAAQWIPDQLRKGYLEDVTEKFAAGGSFSIRYDEAIWKGRGRALRPLAWQEELRGNFTLPMIPLAQAQAIAAELPEGLIVNVVRSARKDRINRITHTGFVVIKDGKRYIRHASYGQKRVVDEAIERFLGRHAQMRKWKVEGIHLLAVRDNGARVQALLQRHAAASLGGEALRPDEPLPGGMGAAER